MTFFAQTFRVFAVLGALSSSVAMIPESLSVISVARAQSANQIVVQGSGRVDAETVRAYFYNNGEPLTQAKIDEGVAGLRASGLFRDVRVSRSGGRLIVNVSENAVLNRVVFEGNKKIKSDVLASEVQSRPRGPFSREVVQADVQRIYEMYRRMGRFDVSVDPKTIDSSNGRVDLVFEIVEGKKTAVKSIEFVGNRAYSSGRLKDVITTAESGIMSILKNNDIYDPDRINADQELLRRFYLRNGYADFRIVSAQAEFVQDKGGFVITIVVDEGEQYRFGTVDVVSNIPGIESSQIRSGVHMSSGSVYNVELVDKSLEDISLLSARRGYAFAQVRPRGERDAANRLVNIAFVVEEGPRVYIERIQVRGNSRTQDHVVRREFDVAEGDAYNRVLIDRAERRLKMLNYFKNVRISSEPGSAPDRVVVNVDVEDQSTGEFSIGGGYVTNEGFIAEASVTERNFLGRGQYVRLGGQLGARTTSVTFSFTEPYFLDYRLSAGFDIYHRRVNNSVVQVFDSTTTGGTLRVGLPVTDNITFMVRYNAYAQYINIQSAYVDCVGAYTVACLGNGEASMALRQLNDRTRFVSMIGYSLNYNTLDSSTNPSRGITAEFRQDFAGVGGDAQFLRTEADFRYYREIFSEYIGMIRLQGGHILSLNGSPLAAVDQYFKGPEVVRGFSSNGLGPRDIATVSAAKLIPDSIGGTTYWGASAEVTFPLSFMPKDFGMRGAIFADAGAVFGYNAITTLNGLNVNLDGSADHIVRSSVGLGILWASPFGPIRFDYAFVLSKGTYDQVQAFRFSGGTRF